MRDSFGCYCDWGPNGGKCYEFWKCAPCCGDPCNFRDGCYCCLSWMLCFPCNVAKLYSHSVSQTCACVNHCMPLMLMGIPWGIGYVISVIIFSMLRFNLRTLNGIGEPRCQPGDCLMVCPPIMNCFSFCQMVRSVPIDAWDCFSTAKRKDCQCFVSPCVFTRDVTTQR